MARIIAVLLAASVASISEATSPPRWWRVLRYSTFSLDDTRNPRLAPNNGWSICRDEAGNLHVTWTEEDGNEVDRVYYRKSADDGRNWEQQTRVSHQTASWARDAVVATVGSNPVYVGVAWNDSMADTSHIKYRQSENGGDWWYPELRPSMMSADSHRWSALPSLSMGVRDGHEYANVVFVDSSYLKYTGGAGDFWETHISHRRVNMDAEPGGELYPTTRAHAVSDASVMFPQFPSVCQERDGRYAR